MKKNTHPQYQEVLFVDSSTGYRFVCGSALQPKEKEVFEGKEYPMCRLSVSSASHPFFTGSKALVDAEGRVEKFKKRYATPTKTESPKEEAHAKEDEGKGKQHENKDKKDENKDKKEKAPAKEAKPKSKK